MLAVIFRRHLAEGVPYEDYLDAWRAEKGYGVKARVLNATSLDDEREVLTIGFVGISTHAMKLAQRFLHHHDKSRHDRIEDVIDSRPQVARYSIAAEHRVGRAAGSAGASDGAVRVGSRQSMLRFARPRPSDEPPGPSQWLVLASSYRTAAPVGAHALQSARTPPCAPNAVATLLGAVGVDDGTEVLNLLFVNATRAVPDWSREWVESGLDALAADANWQGTFRLRDEHDFEKDPIAVPIGSRASILPPAHNTPGG